MSMLDSPRPRGRPRKVLPPPKPRPPLTHRISQWTKLTGWSRSTTVQAIYDKELRAVKGRKKQSPWRILCTEYLRLGFVRDLSELIEERDPAVPTTDRLAAGS
jgi:hypothetical protein